MDDLMNCTNPHCTTPHKLPENKEIRKCMQALFTEAQELGIGRFDDELHNAHTNAAQYHTNALSENLRHRTGEEIRMYIKALFSHA